MSRKRTATVSYNPQIRRAVLVLAALTLLLSLTASLVSRAAELPTQRDGVTTLLLVGVDNRDEQADGRTDTMMLMCLNQHSGAISLVSLQRDLYVDIPNAGKNRLNAAHAIGQADPDQYGGGVQLLRDTIEANLGVTVDGHVLVDFSAVEQVVDAFGGVELTLTEAEAAYLQGLGGNNKDGEAAYYTSGRTYDVTEGKNRLMGAAALDFLRARHVDIHSDFGRTDRQKRLLTALLKAASKDVLGALPAVQTGLTLLQGQGCDTDLSLVQMMGCAVNGLTLLSGTGGVSLSTIPQENHFRDVITDGGMAVIEPDSWTETKATLQRLLQ